MHLLSARRDHEQVDAGDRGRRLRAFRDPPAAQAVPRSDQRDQRSRACAGLREWRHGQPQPIGRVVSERGACADRREAPSRRHDRPGSRAEDRPGHAAAVDRVDDRGGERELRRRSELLVPGHDFVAGADVAAADAEQPAGGVRAAVRRRKHRGPARDAASAVAEPAGFGDGRGVVSAAEAARGRSEPARSVPDRRARNRAAGPEGRRSSCRTISTSRARRRACPRTSKSTSS